MEAETPEELADGAKAFADVAIVVISRFSAEGWDRSGVECTNEPDPWNDGETMPQISTALAGWQGGMEGGLAMAELLTGNGNPSGKLVDTFAADLKDYPSTENFHESFDYVNYTEDIYVGYRYFETIPGAREKVVYPFGYGLSYTAFSLDKMVMRYKENQIFAEVDVTNTGDMAGKEVVQLYFEAPQGILKKPLRQLVAFAKTRLLQPGETQRLRLAFHKADMASYDDLGKIKKSAYILEKGTYRFYMGTSVRNIEELPPMELDKNEITSQCSSHLVPTSLKERMLSDGSLEQLPQSECHNMNECVFEKMKPGSEEGLTPAERAYARGSIFDDCGKKQFIDVAEGNLTLDAFMAQLSDEDLIHLLGGQPNVGAANTYGVGNLPDYGVPSVMTADGPAGLRFTEECEIKTTAWPCATLLACTWNPSLVQQIGAAGAEEVKENNLAVWLTPAVNIHRNPLCGRNFEYYSEDPLISGKMGASMVKGIQSLHIGACVKHFAANNKEINRKNCDSRVSERALREIYLKSFEIVVKESQPWTLMSSFNAINGYRASENHELLEDILRGEWKYEGIVFTDWWTRGEHYKEIKAGNDIKMGTGFPNRVKKAMEMKVLNRVELEHCARRVLEFILKID